MEKQEWQIPELTEIDIADETQADPVSGDDGVAGLGVDPLGS